MNANTVASLDAIFIGETVDSNVPAAPGTTIVQVAPTANTALVPVVPEDDALTTTRLQDHAFATKNLKDLITTTDNALTEAIALASGCDSPKAYESVAALVKASIEAHKTLMDIHKQTADLR